MEKLLDKIEFIERTRGKPIRPGLIVRDGLSPDAHAAARKAQAFVMTLQDIANVMPGS